MVQNLSATVGFLLLLWADFRASRGKVAHSGRIKSAGYTFVGFSIGFLAAAPGPDWPLGNPETPPSNPIIPLNPAILAAGILIAFLSLYLLLRTVFFDFGTERGRKGSAPGSLVTSASYGLCRHPGFWWFSLLALDLAAMRGFGGFLFSAVLYVFLDFLLVLLQDVYLFPKIFKGYDDYRKSVPFLFPRKRASRCGGE